MVALALTLALHAQTPAQSPSRRVLFIGNSYTYVNNLPEMLRGLAASRGLAIDVGMATTGGWKLSDHWTQADSAAHRLLRDRKWDIVVLQEQSTLGSAVVIDGVARVGPDDQFQRYAKLWQEEIHRAGMTPAFYLTWARKGAPQDQAALDRAYSTAARAARGASSSPSAAPGRARVSITLESSCSSRTARIRRRQVPTWPPVRSSPRSSIARRLDCRQQSPARQSIRKTSQPASDRREPLAALSETDAAALQREAWTAWQEVKRHGR